MHLSRTLFSALVGVAFVATSLVLPSTAHANDLEFTVVEYRLVQAKDLYKTKTIGDAEIRVPVMELELRGNKKKSNTEVKWTVPDADPYLKLLGACSNGRLRATVDVDDDDESSIKGKGELEELYCRVILR